VAEINVHFDKGAYQFKVDLQKWDEKSSSAVKIGSRNFPLPASLWANYSVSHFKTQLAGALPPTTAGAERNGETISDDTKMSTIAAASPETPATAFLVFNLDKNATAGAPQASGDAPALARTVSMTGPVKAGSGPIAPERELNTELSLYQDSGTNYLTVTARNGPQGISYEGKWSVSDSNLTSTTLKEFKSKLAGFPKTSDRGVLIAASGTKNVKDQDKMGALGIKGKKGDTVKFSFTFEIAPPAGAVSLSAVSAPSFGDAAPDIEVKLQYHLVLNVSLLEGSVFLALAGKGAEGRETPLPEARKTAALPKVTFSVFKLSELMHLMKGSHWPILQHGWGVFERPATKDKVKVPDSTTLEKMGITVPYSGSNSYNFTFAIDPNAPLPTGDA